MIVILASAVPTFAGLLLDSRRDAAVLGHAYVHAARQLAALRGEDVNCAAARPPELLGASDWSSDLLITTANSEVQRSVRSRAPPGAMAAREPVTIGFGGTSFARSATLSICDRRGPPAHGR